MVIKEYLERSMRAALLSKKYNISNESLIQIWVINMRCLARKGFKPNQERQPIL